ncbi:MAG: twin-arginine translocase subunit TatC [Bacillota bacterium]
MAVEKSMSWIAHLEELRRVLVVSLIALLVATFGCFFYSNYLLTLLERPIASLNLPLYFTAVGEGFFVKINLALYAGFVVAFPIIAWQIWRFIVPALYPHEKRYIMILVPVSVLLFGTGVVFSYFFVLPVAIKVLIQIAGQLEPILTVKQYLSFCMTFLIPFGLVFEMPIIAMFLTRIGVVTPKWLASKRKYALLIIFILAAVLTPGPDPLSQLLMGGPMYVLYEVSILVSYLVRVKKKKAEEMFADQSE